MTVRLIKKYWNLLRVAQYSGTKNCGEFFLIPLDIIKQNRMIPDVKNTNCVRTLTLLNKNFNMALQ